MERPSNIPSVWSVFDSLPDAALIDVKTVSIIVGKSVSSVWRDARHGRFPRPVKIGPMSTRWPVGDIRTYLANLSRHPSL